MGPFEARPSIRRRPPASGMLLVLAALTQAGCGRGPGPVPDVDRNRRPITPWILALPNPVRTGKAGGKTMITWDAAGGNPGRVFLSVDGGPDKPFSTSDRYYADAVVQPGHRYDFKLYPTGFAESPLAAVRVTVAR